jgi:hypothetical protein
MNRIYSICDDVNKPGNEMLRKISRSTDLPNEPREIFGKLRYFLQLTQFISHRLAGENLKGSTVTARACLIGANSIDAGGL